MTTPVSVTMRSGLVRNLLSDLGGKALSEQIRLLGIIRGAIYHVFRWCQHYMSNRPKSGDVSEWG